MQTNKVDCGVEYRNIPGYPGYRAGSDGTVWSRFIKGGCGSTGEEWRMLVPAKSPRGYYKVTLCVEGKKYDRLIHRMVLLAFCGQPPSGTQGCHNDGNQQNNQLNNLRWDTPVSNNRDKKAHGTWQVGEKSGKAKLTNEQVLDIRKKAASGNVAFWRIGSDYGVSASAVGRIASGISWPHLGGERSRRVITENEVREIREMISNGVGYKVISAKYGIDRTTVSNINTRKTWSHVD